MNKKNYLFLVLHFLVLSALAQSPITLTSLDQNKVIGNDTLMITTNLATFDSYAEPKTNALWDFTDATYEDLVTVTINSANTSTDFPDADISELFFRPFGTGLSYDIEIYSQSTDSKLESIAEDEVIPLGGMTGNIDDNLTFPKQLIPYTGTYITRTFPSNMGDNWMSVASRSTLFNISIAAFGLNETPGEYRTTETVLDTVVGWGEAVIKDHPRRNAGRVSAKIPVQQLHRKRVRIDSFYVGGVPAPKALLDAFGLVQGSTTTFYSCYLYRQGELAPLVELYYDESEYKNTEFVRMHYDDFERETASTSRLELQNAVSVYPNPVQNYIYVDLPNEDLNEWSYTITSMQGQVIAKDHFDNDTKINITENVANGIYLLQLHKADIVQSVSRIAIKK